MCWHAIIEGICTLEHWSIRGRAERWPALYAWNSCGSVHMSVASKFLNMEVFWPLGHVIC